MTDDDENTEKPQPPEGFVRVTDEYEPPEEAEILAGKDLDWVTETDELILGALYTGLTLTPSVIADNIDRSREAVSRRLNSLRAGGLVEKVSRGKYEITREGWAYVGLYGNSILIEDDSEQN
jgi:DNA-binding transcriptional ArsR family regulator